MFDTTIDYLKSAVSSHVFPGCCIGVIHNNQRWIKGIGTVTYEHSSKNVDKDTLYDTASLTKAIPVALLAHIMIEKEQLSPNALLIEYIPEYKGNYRDDITIRHLLTHTLHFGFRLSSLKGYSPEEILLHIYSADLLSLPGTVFSYANTTSILLGNVIERIAGTSIDTFAEEVLFQPLGMTRTTFHPQLTSESTIAPTEYDEDRGGLLCGMVHDESACSFYPKTVGSAGMFSTGNDLLTCVQMVVNGGTLSGKKYLNHSTIKSMYKNALPVSVHGKASLGWELDQPFMGTIRHPSTFGKTGFTGCSIVIDPVRNIGIVLLSNHVFPKRLHDRTVINNIRMKIADMIFDEIDSMG